MLVRSVLTRGRAIFARDIRDGFPLGKVSSGRSANFLEKNLTQFALVRPRQLAKLFQKSINGHNHTYNIKP